MALLIASEPGFGASPAEESAWAAPDAAGENLPLRGRE